MYGAGYAVVTLLSTLSRRQGNSSRVSLVAGAIGRRVARTADRKGAKFMDEDRLKGIGEQASGSIKEAVGKLTGDS